MPAENAAAGAVQAPSAVEVAAQRQDIARQLLSSNDGAAGGIIAQLSSNPFFTAVWPAR
jgi:hypothetical protein